MSGLLKTVGAIAATGAGIFGGLGLASMIWQLVGAAMEGEEIAFQGSEIRLVLILLVVALVGAGLFRLGERIES